MLKLWAERICGFWWFSGHGSFSDNPKLNNVIGHILHSAILVPYHGWWVLITKMVLLSCFIVDLLITLLVNLAGGLATEHIIKTMEMSKRTNPGFRYILFPVLDSFSGEISREYQWEIWNFLSFDSWLCDVQYILCYCLTSHLNQELDFLLQMTEEMYRTLDSTTRVLRFTVPFPLFAYPIYLVREIRYSALLTNFSFFKLCNLL